MKRVVALWQQYYKRENGGRARESEDKNGKHGVSMKLDLKRGGVIFFKGREARETPLACSPRV
jgi:hypothetical protein